MSLIIETDLKEILNRLDQRIDRIDQKLEGIQNFKKRLGGELIKGYLWKKDISPLICWAYDSLLLLKLKVKGKKVPLDIIEQETKK